MQDIYQKFLVSRIISTDSRVMCPRGGLFFALSGPRFDGNKYALNALEGGCQWAIIDNPDYKLDDRFILVENVLDTLQKLALYHREKLKIPVIGVTGSNGKTTTKELLVTVLTTGFKVHATRGNFNNHIGVPLTLLGIDERVHQIAIVEMGTNAPGEIETLCSIAKPTHGLITSIGKAHLEKLGTLNGVLKEKTSLYRSVMSRSGTIYLNKENTLLEETLKSYPNVVSYQKNKVGSYQVKTISEFPELRFSISSQIGEEWDVSTGLFGGYNLLNINSALSVGLDFDLGMSEMVSTLQGYSSSNNRSEVRYHEGAKVFLDAYNANPTSMKLAIDSFSSDNKSNKKILILGDMRELGPSSTEEHQKIINSFASRGFDTIALVGEEFGKCSIPEPIHHFEDVNQLKQWFQATDIQGKIVLIKGSRSLKLEQILD